MWIEIGVVMSSTLILQLIVDGIAMGLIYVILTSGLVIIMSTARILFMAYGVFYTVGAYTVWYAVSQFGFPYFISLPIGVLGAAVLGMLTYTLLFQRLQNVEGGFLATLISSMGLQMFLSQGNVLVFGTAPRRLPGHTYHRSLGHLPGVEKTDLHSLRYLLTSKLLVNPAGCSTVVIEQPATFTAI
jgi:branched-chain amino acid transport system permease protein